MTRNENLSYIDNVNLFKEKIESDEDFWKSLHVFKLYKYVLIYHTYIPNEEEEDAEERTHYPARKSFNYIGEAIDYWHEERIEGRIYANDNHYVVDLESKKIVKMIELRL